jgi:hypothetical protein
MQVQKEQYLTIKAKYLNAISIFELVIFINLVEKTQSYCRTIRFKHIRGGRPRFKIQKNQFSLRSPRKAFADPGKKNSCVAIYEQLKGFRKTDGIISTGMMI